MDRVQGGVDSKDWGERNGEAYRTTPGRFFPGTQLHRASSAPRKDVLALGANPPRAKISLAFVS
jgi:hypothetical protein